MKVSCAAQWLIGLNSILLLIGCYNLNVENTHVPSMGFTKKWGPGIFAKKSDPQYRDWIRVKTNGKGNPDFIVSPVLISSPFNEFISFDIRLNNMDYFSGVELRLGDAAFNNYYAFPIPFYSDPLFNIIQGGSWHHFTFGNSHASVVGSPQAHQLKYLGVYVQDNQKGSLIVDIANLRMSKPRLNKGIVSLTFDDGYNEHYWAATILHQYGLRGTAYVMPRQIGESGYLSLDQLKRMKTLYGWGISAHHQTPLTDFSPEQLDKELKFTVDYLYRQGFSDSAPHLAYPLGKQNRQAVWAATKKHFKTARVAGGGADTFPPANIFLIRAYGVTRGLSPQVVLKDIETAVDAGQWVVLMFHYLVEKPADDYGYPKSDFEEIMKRIAEKRFVVMPVHEAAAPILKAKP